MLQSVQVLCQIHVLILQLISPLPDSAHGSVVLTELVLGKKKRLNQANRPVTTGRR